MGSLTDKVRNEDAVPEPLEHPPPPAEGDRQSGRMMKAEFLEPARSARLFIALWPCAALQDALAAWRRHWQWNAGATIVPTERLHLTLHFLGAVPRERLPALREALRLPFAPFELALGRPALWPGGVAVIEPEPLPARLRQLQSALGEAVQSLALPTGTRAFRPHLTMARRAFSAIPPATGPALSWQVREFVLVESHLGGGSYEILQTYA
jgi:2'-5' RNA ligase